MCRGGRYLGGGRTSGGRRSQVEAGTRAERRWFGKAWAAEWVLQRRWQSDYEDTEQGRRVGERKAGSKWVFVWAECVRRLHGGCPEVRKPPPAMLQVYGNSDGQTDPRTFDV